MALDLVDDAQFDWRTAERAKLATVLFTAALAPTNAPLLNPDAVERAYETGGRSLVKGLGNITRDLRTNRGFPRSVDRAAFVVGRDLAITPGAVVFRNEVCELLQYAPMTETVNAIPMVMVPPQINKFYFMDLAPGRSFVEYGVRKGFQMFTISWRNPTEEHRDWGLCTYVDAVNDAVRAACEIVGTEQANTVSLCAGGITTAALLGHLASTQDTLVNCATFAVTLLDYTVPTMIGLLASPAIIENSVRSTKRAGVLRGHNATALFSMLRPNDLIWNYWVRNNLMGEEPPAFDVLAWNSDATRLPAGLHADFLDLFMQNSIATGSCSVHGDPIDLSKVECDSFVVGAAYRPPHRLEGLLRHHPAHGRHEPVRPFVVGPHPEPGQPPGQPAHDGRHGRGHRGRPRAVAGQDHGGYRIVVGALGRVGLGPLRRAPPGTVVSRQSRAPRGRCGSGTLRLGILSGVRRHRPSAAATGSHRSRPHGK